MNFYEQLFNKGKPAGEGMTHFERLFALKLSGGSGGEIKELEGVPPLTFKADGSPLIDWYIKGNTVQNGTPTPQNPVDVLGTGERTENLLELSDSSATANTLKTLFDFGADVTFETITCSCMFDNLEAEVLYGAFLDYLMDDGTHQYVALSGMLNVNDDTTVPTNMKVSGNYYITKQNITFRKIQAYLYTTEYNLFKSGTIKWAFYNSEKKDYEPYGYKIPISMGGTTNNVYLGEVRSTRKIKKYEITGLEGWINRSGTPENTFFCERQDVNFVNNAAICSYYANQDSGSFADLQDKHILIRVASSNDKTYLSIRDSSYPSTNEGVNQLRAYLQQQYAAGTPVTVWYVLATPQTAIVNEPLMRIGDYADSLTATQAGTEIATVKGSNTLDIDTTVKPSNVYIKYKD